MTGLEGLLAGRTLGDRYRIEEVIGRGGMGAVYRAVDERLGREVAVKVITVAGALDPDARERLRARFQREARAAAALPHHPNVVPVYDYGTDGALGLDYIVMELLRGTDLANRLGRAGPPPLSAALRILHEAARGVAVGHRAGLIHRDVKPGNLFLAEHHGEVQVRVLDFGIAKLAEEDDTLAQLTQDGRAPHSPAFASPEQLRGLDHLTPASDVFSLGAVGFQLLTGERPYTDADRNRMSLGMPVPVPAVRARNPAIPGAVAAVVERALAHEPADRFRDAGEMAAALGEALRSFPEAPLEPYRAAAAPLPPHAPAGGDDRTVLIDGDDDHTMVAPPPPARGAATAPPRPVPPPAREPERRRGWGGVVVWSLVLLVLGGAAVAVWMSGGRPEAAVEEEEPVIPPPPDSIPNLAPDVAIAPDTLGTQPELDAHIHYLEGRRLLSEGNAAGALVQLQLARDLAPENAEYRYYYAQALLREQEPEEAVAELRRVTELDPRRTGAYYYLGLAQLEVGDTAAAWIALERVMELATTPAERGAALRRMQDIERAQGVPAPADTALPVPAPPGPDTLSPPADTLRAAA